MAKKTRDDMRPGSLKTATPALSVYWRMELTVRRATRGTPRPVSWSTTRMMKGWVAARVEAVSVSSNRVIRNRMAESPKKNGECVL